MFDPLACEPLERIERVNIEHYSYECRLPLSTMTVVDLRLPVVVAAVDAAAVVVAVVEQLAIVAVVDQLH